MQGGMLPSGVGPGVAGAPSPQIGLPTNAAGCSAPHSERRRHCWSEDGLPRRESASDATDRHRHQVRAFNFTRVSSAAVCDTDAARTGICHAGRAPAAMEMNGISTVGESPSLPRSVHGFNKFSLNHLRIFEKIDITFNVVQIAMTASYCLSHKRGQRQLSTRVDGRIDRLFVNETGRMVNAGDKLAALDFPDLVVTLHNLVSAQARSNRDLFANPRKRLELSGISRPGRRDRRFPKDAQRGRSSDIDELGGLDSGSG